MEVTTEADYTTNLSHSQWGNGCSNLSQFVFSVVIVVVSVYGLHLIGFVSSKAFFHSDKCDTTSKIQNYGDL